MQEHPSLTRLRHARTALDMATRLFRAEVARTMRERERRIPKVDDIAKAANVTRARCYQIADEQKARSGS